MYLKNQTLQRSYRLLLVLLCQIGIVLQYTMVFHIGKVGMLSCYYTMHSNFVCLAYFAWLLIRQPREEQPAVKGGVVLCIAITGLVYHFMLNGAMEAGVGAVGEVTSLDIVANTLVHYVVPIMTLMDYLLFTPKGGFRWQHPFAWLSLPIAYVIFALIRAEVSDGMFAGFSGQSRYPYPFLDVDLFGLGKVLLMVAAILLGALLLGYLLYGLDRLLARASRTR